MSVLSRLPNLSEFSELDVREFARLGGAAMGCGLPKIGTRGPTGEPRFYRRDVIRFLESCRRTRPVGEIQQR
jgi:hypothetical protein